MSKKSYLSRVNSSVHGSIATSKRLPKRNITSSLIKRSLLQEWKSRSQKMEATQTDNFSKAHSCQQIQTYISVR